MTKITQEDIKRINESYYKLKSYAGVARELGYSAATVKKYVIADYIPEDQRQIKRFTPNDLPLMFGEYLFRDVDNYGELCVLSDEEKEEIKELWKEVGV